MATAKVKFSDELQLFVEDLFDYIMTKHKFRSAYIDKQFAEHLSKRFQDSDEEKSSPFTEDIGKAVLTTQYLLRQICRDLFKIFLKNLTRCKRSFIYCVNLTHHICCEFRSSVFWKFIDICAILCEAFLFCDCIGKPIIEIHEAIDILIGFLDIHVSLEFVGKGSWPKLKAAAEEYSATHVILKNYIDFCNLPYVPVHYDCNLIQALRKSPIPFPVHAYWFCDDCLEESDGDFCHTFTSDLTMEEFIAKYGLKQPPWDEDEEDTVQEGPASSSGSSTVREMAYVFVGANREVAMKYPNKEKKAPKKKHKKSRKSASEPSTSQET